MKLISLKYKDPANRLHSYDFDFDNERVEEKQLEPLCFVGLNGSGKSKLLEIIAKIFFFLDANRQSKTKTIRVPDANFTFEYLLQPNRKYNTVRIEGVARNSFEVYADGNLINRQEYFEVMPSNIIGYSSGHNETISPLFSELLIKDLKKIRADVADSGEKGNLDLTRTLFLNRDTTKLLLLASFIFSGYKGRDGIPTITTSKALLSKFKEFINLKALASFRIIIDTDGGRIVLSNRMETVINKLRRCAVIESVTETSKERRFELDFYMCGKVIEAFVLEFETAEDLFEDLYELYSLNLISSTKSKTHIAFDIPEDKLNIIVNKPLAETTYQNLSDGEHQFIQIFAALVLFSKEDSIFLLDEPESHFNPAWRAKFILLLNDILSSKQRSSEFLISTHSPYLVSACRSQNVTIFERDGDSITSRSPRKETFGATFEDLLRDLFEIVSSVSEHSKKSIEKILDSKDIERMKEALVLFGESPYKRDIYEAILRSGTELKLKDE